MLASPEPSVVSFAPLVRTSPLRLTICPFRRGYRVTPPLAPEGLADLMHARQVIEGANAELAAQRSGPAMLWALQSTVDELRRAPHGPSFAQYRAYWQADERFHRLIAESAGNPYLVEAYTALSGLVQRFRLFNGLGVTDADFAIAEHTAVLDALDPPMPSRPGRLWSRTSGAYCSGPPMAGTRTARDTTPAVPRPRPHLGERPASQTARHH